MPSGAIFVHLDEPDSKNPDDDSCAVYCRVSSHNKKEDLQRQLQRCLDFCSAKGWRVTMRVSEVASGMNDRRPRLLKLLDSRPRRLLVEHKDRLTRFGFNHLEVLLRKLGTEVVVINRDDDSRADLMSDLVSIVTSFCCRIYGARRGKEVSSRIRREVRG